MEGGTFLGSRVPKSVVNLPQHLSGLDKQTFRSIIQVIVASIEGKEIPDNALNKIKEETNCENNLEFVYAGFNTILSSALKVPQSSLKSATFQEVLKTLKIPADFIDDLTNAVYGKKRFSLDKANLALSPTHTKLTQFKWRIDVTISTSLLSRVLQPTILMEFVLSNGKKYIFEVSISKFHLLRYNVASVLKEMDDIEKRSIIKAQD